LVKQTARNLQKHDQSRLSDQERNLLRALKLGGTVASASAILFISPHTGAAHVRNLRRKSGLRHLVQIVAWAYDNGWLP
jgi:DNA-binding CsgD family transcriptional regulator